MGNENIIIKGAKEHNLKNIDIEIPRDKLIVITGLSGSGKSSLAFDTIYAEGQRRYVESLSAYARQFLEQMDKPDVESIEGLSPAISIEQKTTSKNPRSTVGTVTEIYDYLRLLFARIGKPYCYKCGREITSQTVQQIVDQTMELEKGSRINILSPIVRGRKGEYKKDIDQLRKDGYVRVKIDGEIRDLNEDIILDKNKKHDIDVVVDRLIIKEGVERRLADSIETALNLSQGIVKIDVINHKEFIFSERFACIDCGVSYPEITPRVFSFNNPYGACSTCSGLGNIIYFDPKLIVPDENLSLREGAIAPWEKKFSIYFHQTLDSLADHYSFDIYTPFKDLPDKVKNVLLYGSGDEEIEFYYYRNGGRYYFKKNFEGVINNLNRRYKETDSEYIKEELERYMNYRPCPECNGARLKKEFLNIKIDEKSIYDISRLTIKECLDFFNSLKLNRSDMEIARRILKEIRERLGFLVNVGVDYLTLDRMASTLSGGEGQRIR